MEKKSFNPQEWLQKPIPKPDIKEVELQPHANNPEVESLIAQIEQQQIDITAGYNNWRDLGFAFADAFGEQGREYFHRISQFNQGYSQAECDSQYSNCLKSHGQGITLRTFFFLAKQAGLYAVTLNPPSSEEESEESDLHPTFPESIYSCLPDFLQRVVSVASSDEERDILLLGSLVSLSACFPKIYGIYDGKKVYPNMFLFVTARASAGKGRLVHCKQLVKPVHRFMREQARLLKQQYEMELAEYLETKGKDADAQKPAKPPEKMLFIPANNSSTGVFQLLSDNEGSGLLFETEGDTLSQAFKSDYGNYSDGFRKAFHHETISYYRRTDREYVDMENPRLSAVLSGTPRQVSSLIPNAENGLFSRFIFYFMNLRPEWKDVFASSDENGLDDYFENLGNEFFTLYQSLGLGLELPFSFTLDQQLRFHEYFQQTQDLYLALQGIDYMATVRRLGLIAFRITMILSALRIMETGNLTDRLICSDTDFNSTLQMITILVKHASKVFSELPAETPLPKRKNQKEKFLDALPLNFNRQQYLKVASSLSIPDKTAEGYITGFCKMNLIHREKQDCYYKTDALTSIPRNGESQDAKEVKD